MKGLDNMLNETLKAERLEIQEKNIIENEMSLANKELMVELKKVKRKSKVRKKELRNVNRKMEALVNEVAMLRQRLQDLDT